MAEPESASELEARRIAIEEERLKIEKERWKLEEDRLKRDRGIRSALNRNFAAIITGVVSLAAVGISVIQFTSSRTDQRISEARTDAQLDREWRFKAADFVARNANHFFGEDSASAARMARVLVVGFPPEIADSLVKNLVRTTPSNEVAFSVNEVQERASDAVANAARSVATAEKAGRGQTAGHPPPGQTTIGAGAIQPSPRPRRIEAVVLHSTETTSDAGDLAYFNSSTPQQRGNSIHYLVLRSGRIAEFVPEAQVAWHVRGSATYRGKNRYNDRSIGITLSHATREGAYPEPQTAALVKLLAGICRRHGLIAADIIAHRDLEPGRRIDPTELDVEALRVRVAAELALPPR